PRGPAKPAIGCDHDRIFHRPDRRGDRHRLPRVRPAQAGALLMTFNGWLQILVFFVIILALARPIGAYMFRVFEAQRRPLPRTVGAVERGLLRLCGLKQPKEQTWLEYTIAVLVFSALGLVVTYLIQRTQGTLPLNPQELANVPRPLAFNTASSFATNTN